MRQIQMVGANLTEDHFVIVQNLESESALHLIWEILSVL
jgi:hypothetical protein